MKNKMVGMILVLFTVILISQVFSQNKQTIKKEVWEYKYYTPYFSSIASSSTNELISLSEINKLGQEGWEVVTVQPETLRKQNESSF